VDCYNAAKIRIGEAALVSQYSFLCAASHDYEKAGLPGFQKPIEIGSWAWICADVFVGPGITVGEGAVVGARASVFHDVEPWTVVAGNPATFLRSREWRPTKRQS
jgi:putative colanic acid biosynthesis acetyltransferase WcaF